MNSFNEQEIKQRINDARNKWGIVFSSMRDARERWSSAWYAVENKQSWIDEEEQRLSGIEREIQKAREDLATRKRIMQHD